MRENELHRVTSPNAWAPAGLLLCGLLLVPSLGSCGPQAAAKARRAPAAPPAVTVATPPAGASSMSLRGDQEGTAFQSLTVEGEDRVHLEFERPALALDLDPARAPGLDWGSARDVLDRTQPDLMPVLAQRSSVTECPFLAKPWLRQFASGPVARFRPQMENVERWKLVVANSRGEAVTAFVGEGRPPRELEWDGRMPNGRPAMPGLTYSYVLEAFDRAGNKRNFVGPGFELSTYRLQTPTGPILLATGALCGMRGARASGFGAPVRASDASAPPLLLEAASWLNQSPQLGVPIRVTATARNVEQANALAGGVARALAPRILGNPSRLQVLSQVAPDAPESGTVEIAPAR